MDANRVASDSSALVPLAYTTTCLYPSCLTTRTAPLSSRTTRWRPNLQLLPEQEFGDSQRRKGGEFSKPSSH
ncbi:hypothetical protein VPH35_021801 [Triticum aestivum]